MAAARSIVIIDYKIGNKHSITSALEQVKDTKDTVCLTDNPDAIERCSHLIFPGVGAIRDCKNALEEHHLPHLVQAHIKSGKPLFAICVGMQLLFQRSEENGGVDCLGLFGNTMQRLTSDTANGIKVPHIGWNQVHQNQHQIWQDIPNATRFYFVHSYAALEVVPAASTIGSCVYGHNHFAAASACNNVIATQFHPEKSHKYGLQLLRNFLIQES